VGNRRATSHGHGSCLIPSSVVSSAIPCPRVLKVVLDTCILVSATRSRRGASFQVLSKVGTGTFDVVISVPLVLEYEDALMRQLAAAGLQTADVHDLIDYVCSIAERQTIFFLWRPLLKDPKDDMVAEVAVAAGCDAIVTHNVRDFVGVERFGVKILTPADLLKKLGERE
jgi:predicted nucleic acid-binding protein